MCKVYKFNVERAKYPVRTMEQTIYKQVNGQAVVDYRAMGADWSFSPTCRISDADAAALQLKQVEIKNRERADKVKSERNRDNAGVIRSSRLKDR